LAKPIEQLTSFEKWLLFLRFAPILEQRSKINDIIREKEEIAMAATILQEISQNEDEKALFRSRKMAEMDMYHNKSVFEKVKNMLAESEAKHADKDAVIADMGATITNKDAVIADKDAVIARLMAELEKR
ncbi:MAG: hypothetical protein FWD26_04075, partial [Treponema sp.]|nr:hypothetical protein [Treponema sp.]